MGVNASYIAAQYGSTHVALRSIPLNACGGRLHYEAGKTLLANT
jgi:hypothetical protein